MRDSFIIICIISLFLIMCVMYVWRQSMKKRKEMIQANSKLEEENRIFNEENRHAIAEITEIRDIIASANMGTWRIELVDGQEPRMYVDRTMSELLGISGQDRTPEQTYTAWFSNVKAEAVQSVLDSVQRMEDGYFDENTYIWMHPTKGERYVRCGGTSQPVPGGFVLRGYHYDVDEVVRDDQARVNMLRDALDAKNEYYSTLGTLGDIFYSLHVINLADDTVVEFNAKNEVKEIVNSNIGASDMMARVIGAVTSPEYRDAAIEFTNLQTIPERMKDKRVITKQFVGNNIGWYDASFISMEKDEEEKPTKVIFATRVIDEEKKQEETLIKKTQTDELTGLLNRRAYEEDIYAHNDIPAEDNFIYVSLDVNGLKVVNDTQGHTAGDELIIGACQCMRDSLGAYGKLYRIGGDEFVAILSCDAENVDEIFRNFDNTIAAWKGELVEGLSISYGWISKDEEPKLSVRQLGAIAEERMYSSKSAHYRKQGVDRRGQLEAHKALCELYTKILKINIADDSYQIINMDSHEQNTSQGFSDKISHWLKTFGTSGQVHPEDLDEYLKKTDIEYIKDYFSKGKTSLHILYRRKIDDTFKRVMMEIIPANDYAEDAGSFFLYVKNIDI